MLENFPIDSPLRSFTRDEIDAIFGAGMQRTCAAQEIILTEGEPGFSMYFVLDGQTEARVHSGKTVRTYGPGAYFGELSFINPGHRRSATIVATAATRLVVLDQASVHALIATHPGAVFNLLRRTCAFLVDAEANLAADLRRQNAELQETIKHLDFTRRRLSQEEVSARTDGLTGLYNRRAFDDELPVFMERAAAIGSGLALLVIDLDHFKPVNDTLGHAAGDVVLKEVSRILREGVRKTDLPCRVGGDEFIVLLSDLSPQAAHDRAEALRRSIEAFPHPGNDQGIRVTASMGGAMARADEAAPALMHRADEALYAAKRAGRNRVGWAP